MIQQYSNKTWQFRELPPHLNPEKIRKISEELDLSEEMVKLLILRGISESRSIKDFLSPSLNHLPRPFLMKGMKEGVNILVEALKSGRPVTVYGDFDADGVTSTAVLTLFFKELGMFSDYYIPDRLTEGYGLNSDAVRKIYGTNMQQWNDPGVLITADCGISDVTVVDEAKNLGFTVIITDHHKPPEYLPQADAILNPLQPECPFPCKNLAGVGVTFYLILGLRSELMKNGYWSEEEIPNLKSYMDLAAIGTVADQVPISACNRIIVKAGLEVLNQRSRIGLLQLLNGSRDYGAEITSEDIAFRIAPRINAIGRIGSAQTAVDLLGTGTVNDAERLADELEEANKTRKTIEADIFAEAVQMIASETLETSNSILLYKNNWHQGVLGIVASRLTDRYHRPAILLADCCTTDVGANAQRFVKGSARSIEGIDIHQAISSCMEMLERFGGHEGAAGVTLPRENIESFKLEFDRKISEQMEKRPSSQELLIDMELSLETLTDPGFLSSCSMLGPYGSGNPAPVFCIRAQELVNPRLVGNNHLRFTIMAGSMSINGIGFGFGNHIQETRNRLMDLAFTLRLNYYMGRNTWEINLVDLRPMEQ